MIPTPKLDDRTFEDIVEEAIRLIPQYCPEWTNFNKADPGITLIELFAWMMEMVLYRLNRVPDKNYLAFLNLMGIRLRPPQPARAVVTFLMSDKGDHVKVRRGTTVSTKPATDGTVITFETESDVLVVQNKILKCYSQYGRKFSDNTPFLTNPLQEGFEPFAGTIVAERYLYFGDPSFSALTEGSCLRVRFRCPHPHVSEFLDLLEWQIFDGVQWTTVVPLTMESDAESVVIPATRSAGQTTVNDVQSYFVRARLVEVPPTPDITILDTIVGAIKITGEGLPPEVFFTRSPEDIYTIQETTRKFYPFGRESKPQTEFYIRSDMVFKHVGALVRLDITVEGTDVEKPNASPKLMLVWEYYNGKLKKWKLLGRSIFADRKTESGENIDFTDTTNCLTQSGIISFRVPEDISQVDVNGVEGLFIRCRIEEGDYGVPGSYELEGDRWIFRDDRPLRPPVLREIAIRFEEHEHPFEYVFAENDGVFSDYSDIARVELKPFQPLSPVSEASPTMYLGFQDSFPNEEVQIYFKLKDDSGVRDPLSVSEAPQIPVRVAWEYWNGKTWANLFPKDETRGFLNSGFLKFIGPPDFRRSKRFGENLFYIRARLEMGGYVEPPRISRILLNSVYALNLTTFGETIIGSSQGTPHQIFKLPPGPVLPGQELIVLEKEEPSDADKLAIIEEEGENAIWKDPNGNGYWVRWHEIDDLYESNPHGRHYVKDIVTGEIRFGDGVHGMIPPKGDRNIRLARYQVGGGVSGNLPQNSLTVLMQSIPFIEGVNNFLPSEGGADLETVEEIKARAPHIFRSRYRAVTTEDFEWIAKQASTSVARAKCIPCKERVGEVTVIVVPKAADDFTSGGDPIKPLPSTELMRKVKHELDKYKLISTIVHVVRPKYRNLKISVTIIRQHAGSSETIKTEINKRIREFLHPLRGGKSKRGWPFGRAVSKVDIYHVCQEVGGVDFVDKVTIRDLDSGMDLEYVRLEDDELPFVMQVEVIERAQERIL